jgi:hypothetical protein
MKTLKSNLPTILANGSMVVIVLGVVILSMVYGINSGGAMQP